MNVIKDLLSCVDVVRHEELNALSIDVISARDEVLLRDIRHAFSKALPVQVFLAVLSLVLNHVERHHDVLEACLLASRSEVTNLLIAAV